MILEETPTSIRLATNLLAPDQVSVIKKTEIDEQFPSQISSMPAGLLNVLTRDEINDLLSFVEAGDALPDSVMHAPSHTSNQDPSSKTSLQ